MPEMDPSMFGSRLRYDGKPGFIELVPTGMGFAEADRTDVRMRRLRIFNEQGDLEGTFLVDPMGVWWADLPDVCDDVEFLEHLHSRNVTP